MTSLRPESQITWTNRTVLRGDQEDNAFDRALEGLREDGKTTHLEHFYSLAQQAGLVPNDLSLEQFGEEEFEDLLAVISSNVKEDTPQTSQGTTIGSDAQIQVSPRPILRGDEEERDLDRALEGVRQDGKTHLEHFFSLAQQSGLIPENQTLEEFGEEEFEDLLADILDTLPPESASSDGSTINADNPVIENGILAEESGVIGNSLLGPTLDSIIGNIGNESAATANQAHANGLSEQVNQQADQQNLGLRRLYNAQAKIFEQQLLREQMSEWKKNLNFQMHHTQVQNRLGLAKNVVASGRYQ